MSTEGKLRWLIFNAETNGLSSSLVRVEGRLYVDVVQFNRWLEERRQKSLPTMYSEAV